MSKYHTQFEESTQTIGTNLAGWTHRTAGTAPAYVPAYGAPALKRRYLSHSPGTFVDLRGLITWDAIDGDANRANCNLLTCIKADDFTSDYADLWARVAMSGTTIQDGYRLRLVQAGGAGNLTIDKRVASVTTLAIGSATVTISAGKSYFIRFDLNGTALKARVWDAALGKAGEPTTWDINITDSSVSAAGYTGLAAVGTANTEVVPWNFFAVGTNGDTAVCPRTNLEFLDWVSKPNTRAVLAELEATGYDSASSPYTKIVKAYVANHGYTSHPQDTPSQQHYDNHIASIPTFSREMAAGFSGPVSVGFGDLVLKNPAQRSAHEKYTAIDLNGSTNYVLAASSSSLNFGTGSFSVMVRGRYDDYTAPRAFGGVTKPGSAWNTAAGWGFGQGHTGTSIFAWIHDGTNFASGYITCDAGFRPNDLIGQFVEILYIVDRTAGTMKVMINGVLQSGSISISSVTGSVNNANNFQVGLSVGWYHDGLLDEVRAWSRALAQSEGVALYKRRPVDTSANLALLWPCNEGTGTSVSDKSGNANTGTISGTATWATGTRTLVNNEDTPGRLDDWLRVRWNRNTLRMWIGDPAWPRHDFRELLVGRLGQPSAPTVDTLKFPIADLGDVFNADLQTDYFTTGDYNGQPKPIFMGQIGRPSHGGGQIEPPLTDAANLIYTLTDDDVGDWWISSGSNMKVYDNQVLLQTGNFTVSAVNTGTETITASAAHGFVDHYVVRFVSGTPPAPLALDTDYFTVSTTVGGSDFKLSATRGGAAINLTAATTGATLRGFGYAVVTTGPTTVQLAATPAGRVTVSDVFVGSGGEYPDELYRNVLNRIGLSANFIGTIQYPYSDAVGVWFDTQKRTALDALTKIATGTLSWFGFSTDGLFQSGAVDVPTSVAVKSLTYSNITPASLKMADRRRAVDFNKSMIYRYPWFLTGGPFQTGSQAALQGRSYSTGYSYGASSIPLDGFPNNMDSDGNFTAEYLFTTAFSRYVDFYKQPLGLYEFQTTLGSLWHANGPLSIGDTISLEHPRLGWRQYTAADPASPDNTATIDARLAVVMGINVNLAAKVEEQVTLKVYRQIPGYYPTANLN